MSQTNYHVETYWDEVAKRIKLRSKKGKLLAGDDEPYYEYKRLKFLELLNEIDFENKSVLEIGCGPGGNLVIISKKHPKKLVGVDISNEMLSLALKRISGIASVSKIDGINLPFDDNSFDIVFTSTVLQHNTSEENLKSLINEICRVSNKQIILFERIENRIIGNDTNLGRPIAYYSDFMNKNNFKLTSEKFLRIRFSYYVSGIIRKLFTSNNKKEGEPLKQFPKKLQKFSLFFTIHIDKLMSTKKDLARLIYNKR